MSLIRINDVHATKLIAAASHVQFVPTIHHSIACYDSNDRLAGGNLYTDYWGVSGSCQIHTACFNRRAVSKAMMFLAFHYPFEQLKVKKLFGFVAENNVSSRNFCLKLGFKIEYMTDDVFSFPNGVNGMYLMSMTRDECRWLKMPMPYIEYAPEHMTNPIRPVVDIEVPANRWMH